MKKMAMYVMMVIMTITMVTPITTKASFEDYLTDFEVDYIMEDGINENDAQYIAEALLGDYSYGISYKCVKYAHAPYSKTYKVVFVNYETNKCVVAYKGCKGGVWSYFYISDVTCIPEEVSEYI